MSSGEKHSGPVMPDQLVLPDAEALAARLVREVEIYLGNVFETQLAEATYQKNMKKFRQNANFIRRSIILAKKRIAELEPRDTELFRLYNEIAQHWNRSVWLFNICYKFNKEDKLLHQQYIIWLATLSTSIVENMKVIFENFERLVLDDRFVTKELARRVGDMRTIDLNLPQ